MGRYFPEMVRLLAPFMLLVSAFSSGTAHADSCRLCAPSNSLLDRKADEAPARPIRIEVETALDFSRAAQAGKGGEVEVDGRSGTRRVGGGLVDLGGMGVRGTVRISGTPLRPLRIDMPHRVSLRSSMGALAEVSDLRTDLPPVPVLGSDGTLTFSFGGRLQVRGNAAGVFRGSIPITADYQ